MFSGMELVVREFVCSLVRTSDQDQATTSSSWSVQYSAVERTHRAIVGRNEQ